MALHLCPSVCLYFFFSKTNTCQWKTFKGRNTTNPWLAPFKVQTQFNFLITIHIPAVGYYQSDWFAHSMHNEHGQDVPFKPTFLYWHSIGFQPFCNYYDVYFSGTFTSKSSNLSDILALHVIGIEVLTYIFQLYLMVVHEQLRNFKFLKECIDWW